MRAWACVLGGVGAVAMVLAACGNDTTVASTSTTNDTTTSTTTSSSTTGVGGNGSGATGSGASSAGGMTGSGGSSQGGAATGGASGVTCETCADATETAQCMAAFDACNGTPCELWWDCYTDQCFAGDFSAQCFNTCDSTLGNTLSTALKACLCNNCSGQCTPFCP